MNSTTAALGFEINLLLKDKAGYNEYSLIKEEYHAKKFADYANHEEYEKAKSTLKKPNLKFFGAVFVKGNKF